MEKETDDIHKPKPEFSCDLCGKWTTGQMGSGEYIRTDIWWCRDCPKCPHLGCLRMKCKKQDGSYFSHCGNMCRFGKCIDKCKNGY